MLNNTNEYGCVNGIYSALVNLHHCSLRQGLGLAHQHRSLSFEQLEGGGDTNKPLSTHRDTIHTSPASVTCAHCVHLYASPAHQT